MSSSWPDSLTTWLSSRTDNPTRLVLRENTSLDSSFLLPAKCHSLIQTYGNTPAAAHGQDPPVRAHRNKTSPGDSYPGICLYCRLQCCIYIFVLFANHLMCRFGSDFSAGLTGSVLVGNFSTDPQPGSYRTSILSALKDRLGPHARFTVWSVLRPHLLNFMF